MAFASLRARLPASASAAFSTLSSFRAAAATGAGWSQTVRGPAAGAGRPELSALRGDDEDDMLDRADEALRRFCWQAGQDGECVRVLVEDSGCRASHSVRTDACRSLASPGVPSPTPSRSPEAGPSSASLQASCRTPSASLTTCFWPVLSKRFRVGVRANQPTRAATEIRMLTTSSSDACATGQSRPTMCSSSSPPAGDTTRPSRGSGAPGASSVGRSARISGDWCAP